MKACGTLMLFAFLAIVHQSAGNEILGKSETSTSSQSSSESTVNGKTKKNQSSSALKEITTWELKPDNTCVKRVVVTENQVEIQNTETPIDCDKAKEEVSALDDNIPRPLTSQLLSLRTQQNALQLAQNNFANKIQNELFVLRKALSATSSIL